MNNLRIADMAETEKPVEKLIETGVDSMSDAELLAIVLRTGSRDLSAIALAQRVLNDDPVHKGLSGLNYKSIEDLITIPGIGRVKACQILAILEISKRLAIEKSKAKLDLGSLESVVEFMTPYVRYLTKERVYAIYMATDNSYIHMSMLSEGSIDRSVMSPRELFKEALRYNASNIILVHNHPSGNPKPSKMDIIITKKIKDLGEELGINLLDHVILGDGCYTSFAEKELM